MATPRNPYQPDPEHEPHFVGRRDIFQMVETELRAPEKNSVLLFGPPRIGKTCLLRELQRRLPSPPFLPCYFDLRDRAHGPLRKLLFDLASALAAELHVPAPIEDSFDDQGTVFQTEFLPAFYRALPADYRPVVLLDGFDLLEVIVEKQPQAASAARHFPPFLQRLLETEPRLGFVYAATRRIEDFSTDMQELLRTAREKRVGPLDEQSARALVKLGQEQGALAFAEDAVERALNLTARHPYLLQLVCNILFQRTHGAGEGGEGHRGVPLVTAQEVEGVTRTVLEVGEPYFEGLWAELSAPERVVLSTLAEGTDEGDAVTDETMHTLLRRHGIRILTREMELAPEALVKREVLLRTAAGYQFAVELMRRFVALRRPPEQVEAERRQIVPAANALYQSAVAAHGQGQLVGARDLLERALRMNPNHVPARLRLGQVLQEQGQLDEACRELEEALKYAPEEAKSPLIRTLLLAGEALERAGNQHNADRALEVYERVLALHQREPVALERSRAIIKERGDRAFRAGDLDQALEHYEKSGDLSKAEAIRSRKRTGQVERVAADALGHEARREWAEAHAIYKRLFDEEGERWEVELRRTETEVALQRHYGEAQQALAQERFGAAARSLAEVVALRPDYKDASALLAQASAALWRAQQRGRGGIWGVIYALPHGPTAWLGILCGVLVVALGVQGYLLSGRGPRQTPAGTWVPLPVDSSGPGIKPEAVAQVREQAQAGLALRGGGDGVAGSELAEQGMKVAAAGEVDRALNFFRQAYRAGGDARWLYDLAVLHDRLGQCDDAAFFYRAAVLGKGVQKEDLEPLNGRLLALEEACHFKGRQTTAADKHQRAARFMELELCALAQSVLTGIVTAQEKADLAHCSGAHPEALAVAEKKKPPERSGAVGGGHSGGGATGGGHTGGGGADLPSLLTVTAKPWAVVLLDGQRIGRTPLDGFRIPPGKHVVTLVNDEMKGRQSYPINAVPGNTFTITYSWQK